MATKSLVIVESPAKAKTISGFLGPTFMVESSIGHIRDLPRNAGDIPEAYKDKAWARLGVDVDHDFNPLYVVDSDKKDHIRRLKEMLGRADELYLATDEDREGESIAWHLLEVLKPKIPVKRMAFHEITKQAILNAIREPREIDQRLVDAQEGRRILDRLYGYEVSPVLWKKVMPKLSAGRVQSVATRIIVERESERMRFVAARYSDIEGDFETSNGATLRANLIGLNGERIATGKDFDDLGQLAKGSRLLGAEEGKALAAQLGQGCNAKITRVERKPNRRSPAAPFMTSTLQQEAARKLRFSAARTMRAAQSLYESGHITYMRTDSTTLSDTAVRAARELIAEQYGQEYLPSAPRTYKNKVKNAQEAHEAIRPAGDRFESPKDVAAHVGVDEGKLYELIWKRAIASQMEDSRGETVKVSLEVLAGSQRCEFSATGYTVTFPGFLRAYVEGSDDPESELEQRERPVPPVTEGEQLAGKAFTAKEHETQPPARFTEASLVRRLEELGVGRPSTYASIISTIVQRGYVWKKGSALVPAFKAFAVINLLRQHFGDLVDFAFTARMEDELDAIASGKTELVPWLKQFYFGQKGAKSGEATGLSMGLKSLVSNRLGEIDARAINSLPLGKDTEGREIIVRVGRFGPYLQRGEETARLPDEIAPDELTVDKATELLNAPSGPRELGKDPATGEPVYVRAGRFGAYVQLGEADGKEKPKTCSLLKTMTPESLTLEEALKLLSLPRVVGKDPSDGHDITALLGRYGPYISKNGDSRSLDSEEQLFTLTLTAALELLAQPKQRGRRAASREPLKQLGVDPSSGKPITVREGRFGLYVTDTETNASLRKGDDLENLTLERAQELLEQRRERGPVQKKKNRRASKSSGKAAKASKSSDATEGAVSVKASKVAKKVSKKPGKAPVASKGPSVVKPAANKKATKVSKAPPARKKK